MLLVFLCLLLFWSAHGTENKRTWSCEPISVDSSTSDETKLKADFKIVRISRGVFAVSGELFWNYDVADDTMIEVLSYRSVTGGNDYKLLPFSVPRQSFYDFLNNVYKDVIMPNYGNCSNLPQFKDKFVPPWPRDTYKFDRCTFDGAGTPPHMPEGFYKVIGKIYGEVEFSLTAVGKVTHKIV